MNSGNLTRLSAVGIFLYALMAHADAGLNIGDPAPPIEAMAWIKGEPVKSYQPGHVYVVEFWATWCGPCNAVMPHLSELQRKYAGKVTVIGVDVMESDNQANVEAISAFVRKKGEKMAYTVAMDEPKEQPVFNAWMRAAGVGGIPTSFVVDGAGRVVWLGHPLGDDTTAFEQAIDQALEGKSDLDAARAAQSKVAEEQKMQEQETRLYKPIFAAQQRKDYAAIVTYIDEQVAQSPGMSSRLFPFKLSAQLHLDEKKTLDYVHAVEKDAPLRQRLGLTEEPLFWGSVGNTIAQVDGLSMATYRLALDRLRKAGAAGTADVFHWSLISSLSERLGDLPQAIQAQEKAIALAAKDPQASEGYAAELKETLARLKAKKQ